MMDPLTFSMRVQQAAFIGACCAAGVAAANALRVVKGEQSLFGVPFHRRSDELHVHKDIIATGPLWTDHYGKRAHDVDVEHMR
jgi:hypothetical protein